MATILHTVLSFQFDRACFKRGEANEMSVLCVSNANSITHTFLPCHYRGGSKGGGRFPSKNSPYPPLKFMIKHKLPLVRGGSLWQYRSVPPAAIMATPTAHPPKNVNPRTATTAIRSLLDIQRRSQELETVSSCITSAIHVNHYPLSA